MVIDVTMDKKHKNSTPFSNSEAGSPAKPASLAP
jgi:hypothetical protein